MDEQDQFLSQVLVGISEADVITIFFPLLRRALVVDTRHDDHTPPLVKVMPQVSSMEERIVTIETMRPQFGKLQSILGIPWLKSVRRLSEQGVLDCLERRLSEAGIPSDVAGVTVHQSVSQLWLIERLAYESMIKGEGYTTLWASNR